MLYRELKRSSKRLLEKLDSDSCFDYDYFPFELSLRSFLYSLFKKSERLSNITFYVSLIENDYNKIKFFTKNFSKKNVLKLIDTF